MKKPVKKSKKITLEDLARITQNSLSGMEDRINERLEKLELGQKKMNNDILNLNEKFPSRFEFDNLSARVWNLENKKLKK